MKSVLIALTIGAAMLATPAFAFSLSDLGLKPWVSTDNPDVPNCTVLSHPDGCENVLRSVNGFATSPGTASCPCPWETFTDEHCVK